MTCTSKHYGVDALQTVATADNQILDFDKLLIDRPEPGPSIVATSSSYWPRRSPGITV
jgi:hypothetical protein